MKFAWPLLEGMAVLMILQSLFLINRTNSPALDRNHQADRPAMCLVNREIPVYDIRKYKLIYLV